MVLSEKTKEKIIDIRDFYEKKESIDANFVKEILSVLQQEEKFRDLYQYEFLESPKHSTPAYVSPKEGIVYFHIPSMIRSSKMLINNGFSKKIPSDEIKLQSMFFQLMILHESAHVWQINNCEEYPEINRLYKDIWDSQNHINSIWQAIKIKIKYELYGSRFCNERHANIDALRELVDMYQETDLQRFLEIQHIYHLSFKPKRESIVHDTLKSLNLEYNYQTDNIPLELLFEVGFPIPDDIYHSIQESIELYDSKELSYQEVIQKVKSFGVR